MKIFALALLLTASAAIAHAQTDKEGVESAVMDYVDALYLGDTAKIVRSIVPNVVKYGYYRKKDATEYNGEPMSFQEMLDYANSVKKRTKPNSTLPPFSIQVLDVLDQTASAKLTAWWGNDYILLAKLNGKWMITHVLWQSPPKK